MERASQPMETGVGSNRERSSHKARLGADHQCASCGVKDIAICSPLHGTDLERLGALATHHDYTAGQALLYEGDPAEHVFNIRKGIIRLSCMLPDGRRQITGFLFPGAYLALSRNDTYTVSAEAITQVSACRFSRRKLQDFLTEHPEVENRLLTMVQDELAAAQEQILLLGRKSALERVVSFLLLINERMGGGPDFELPMTRLDIADHLGLTIETVSRSFTKLVKMGLITLPSLHHVAIADRDGLEDIRDGNTD